MLKIKWRKEETRLIIIIVKVELLDFSLRLMVTINFEGVKTAQIGLS